MSVIQSLKVVSTKPKEGEVRDTLNTIVRFFNDVTRKADSQQ